MLSGWAGKNRFLNIDIASSLELVLFQSWPTDGTLQPHEPVEIMEELLPLGPMSHPSKIMARHPYDPPLINKVPRS